MQRLLAVPDWLEEQIQAPMQNGYSRAALHLDAEYGHPAPGFLLMCSIQDPDRDPRLAGGTPHDHGVVYGVYKGAIEQTKYRWVYPEGQWTEPRLTQAEQFVQRAGLVAFFLPGEIHKTVNAANERSLLLRGRGAEDRRRDAPPLRSGDQIGQPSSGGLARADSRLDFPSALTTRG